MREVREIKFRGKRLDNGEWVYGNYQAGKGIHPHVISWWIVHQFEGDVSDEIDVAEVDPSTLGQYIMKDKNGKDVYENQRIKYQQVRYTDCGRTEIESIGDPKYGHLYYAEGIYLGISFEGSKNILVMPHTLTSDDIEVVE